ncbi:hypothetical protein WMY93_015915 [Mugilogobius chulae]|uniref:Vta1/callose synthase N-terminal domain-containing protein n=1 Tax=Mugilogobius chulae TaxID=88201 RepID=A0AAW0NXW3_9GOBI
MALPAPLKAVQHHLRTAQEHEKRDPVVAYYCRLYAMQTGMKLDSKTPECRQFLIKLMDQLETMKKELKDEESITQEVVGNAHIENYALKMFLYADNEDRAGRFHKNMIKSFYTASLLIDVLAVFGELSEENIQHRKYARWKATYIHNCLKNGETPESGPIGMEDEEEAGEEGASGFSAPGPSQYGSFRGGAPSQNYDDQGFSAGPGPGIGFNTGPTPSGPPSGPRASTTTISRFHREHMPRPTLLLSCPRPQTQQNQCLHLELCLPWTLASSTPSRKAACSSPGGLHSSSEIL